MLNLSLKTWKCIERKAKQNLSQTAACVYFLKTLVNIQFYMFLSYFKTGLESM